MNRFKLLFTFLFFPLMLLSQQSIKGTFSPASDYEWVLLYKILPTHSDYVADAKLDDQGNFEIKLDSTHSEGMYRIVYAMPQDEYNFDLIYNAKENIEFTFNGNSGLEYKKSAENQLMNTYTSTMTKISSSIGNFYRQGSKDETAFLEIFKTLDNAQKEFEDMSKGSIAYNFIYANRPYIAKEFQNVNTYISNVKKGYFDHVDFNNEILQSSNFLIERVLNYVFGMTSGSGNPEQIYKENIDVVANELSDSSLEVKKMILGVLWQQLADAKYEPLANYITDTYLLEIAEKLNDQTLLDMLIPFRNTSLGMIAPDFEMEVVQDGNSRKVKLSEYDVAEAYVIVFWSSVCSHCLEELPQLHDYISGFQDGKVKVIAFGLEDDVYRWKSETYNFPEFQHVVGLGKWENKTGNAYNVTSTPTYYVLGKNKEILAKPEDINALKTFLAN